MMTEMNLAGNWQLEFALEGSNEAPMQIQCKIPGNFEQALADAGLVDDPYIRKNAQQLRPYEFYWWRLTREFQLSAVPPKAVLALDGLDTCAECRINGQEVGKFANALIEHRANVSRLLVSGLNKIEILIHSPVNAVRNTEIAPPVFSAYPFNYESIQLRKPAHEWGWDIAPRMVLGGLWRKVALEFPAEHSFGNTYLQTQKCTKERANLIFHFNFQTSLLILDNLKVRLRGKCGESEFEVVRPVSFTSGIFRFDIVNPALWFPRGYGKANLYQVTCELLLEDKVLTEKTFTAGIRTISLFRREALTSSNEPDFAFIVNEQMIRCHGTNHVPADALHANDPERLKPIQSMLVDLNCNMVRMWGGGVYEPDSFYDFCDQNGILIWQDFMMGCAAYPQTKDFFQAIEIEVEQVVKRLRQHPSLAVWAGDNECDMVPSWSGGSIDPNLNRITREVIPQVLRRLDPERPWLPSSPYVSPESFAEAKRTGAVDVSRYSPEQHLWGPRNYFKSGEYKVDYVSFVSEIGYHGSPSLDSIKRFLSPEKLWPLHNNDEWDFHGSNPCPEIDEFLNYRTRLMAKQVKNVFDTAPETLETFIAASQICQAEADKFFIEFNRASNKNTGVLWWNLIDCWPQFSDAIVDYYGCKKLAYDYIRRSQSDFLIMVKDPAIGVPHVVAVNDTQQQISGTCKVIDADTKQTILETEFTISPNKRLELGNLPFEPQKRGLALLQWELKDGSCGGNHYLAGPIPFDLEKYRRDYLPQIAALDQNFVTKWRELSAK